MLPTKHAIMFKFLYSFTFFKTAIIKLRTEGALQSSVSQNGKGSFVV
jgi:hypothetical protein